MFTTNCATTSLDVFVPDSMSPWDFPAIVHLYRRSGFGIDPIKAKTLINQDPVVVVNNIVNKAKNLPLPTAPVWAKWKISDYSSNEEERNLQFGSQVREWVSVWIKGMHEDDLRDKMSLFWHNHFVTKYDKYYCPSWMYDYHKILQKNSLGNFKTFVKEIASCPAMLVYLDNVFNTKFQPNENFARELFELFTLGVDNGYNQQDIVNAAKACTGWNGITQETLCGDILFVPFTFDSGQKTIFGKTGNYDMNGLIDLLFQERPIQISEFICKKIYQHFVNPEVDENIVKDMAKVFRDENFEIAPLMTTLFSSQHFFDAYNRSTIIPGHIEYFINFVNELNFPHNADLSYLFFFGAGEFNQTLFIPVDVAGWPGNRYWATTNSLPFRFETILNIMLYYYVKNGDKIEELRTFVKQINKDGENDVAAVSKNVINYLLPKGLQNESDYIDALKAFKGEVPENYFTSGEWNLDWEYVPLQMILLINHIANLPEFQLK